MEKKRIKLSDEIGGAIDASGMSRYAICKELGIAESLMSRFMNGKGWLGQDNLDALAELLDFHVTAAKRRKPKG